MARPRRAQPKPAASLPKRRLRGGALLATLGIQGAVLAVTLFIMVAGGEAPEPPAFEGSAGLAAPEDPVESRRELKRFQKRSSKPLLMERLTADRPADLSLPPAPDLPVDAFDAEADETFLVETAQDMLAQSGLAGAAADLAAASSAAAFFGVQDSGSRIVLVVNTSASVVRKAASKGISIERIQEEAVQLVEGLGGQTLFGIVQFSQGYRLFAPRLAPAIARNKEEAVNWLRSELRGNPPVNREDRLGHEGAFQAALELEPDLVFLVTDGSLNKRTPAAGGGYSYPEIPYEILISGIDEELRRRGLRTRIHAIGFELRDRDRSGLRRLVRRFGGALREF